MIEEVQKIITALQQGKWEEHSPQRLISAQGKLATYLANIGALAANARKEMDIKELHAKQKEADLFLQYKRDHGMTIAESQANARIDTFNDWDSFYSSKEHYNGLRAVLDAMQTLIIACQITVRELKHERDASKYMDNNASYT